MTTVHVCPICDETIPRGGYHATHDDEGTCPDCGQPLEDTGVTWCSRNGERICPDCHYESDCGCRG